MALSFLNTKVIEPSAFTTAFSIINVNKSLPNLSIINGLVLSNFINEFISYQSSFNFVIFSRLKNVIYLIIYF